MGPLNWKIQQRESLLLANQLGLGRVLAYQLCDLG